MKKILLSFFVLVFFLSCKKEVTPTPLVMGKWNWISNSSTTIPNFAITTPASLGITMTYIFNSNNTYQVYLNTSEYDHGTYTLGTKTIPVSVRGYLQYDYYSFNSADNGFPKTEMAYKIYNDTLEINNEFSGATQSVVQLFVRSK